MICLPKYGGGHRSQTPDLTPITIPWSKEEIEIFFQ